jgi:hypothetical protein
MPTTAHAHSGKGNRLLACLIVTALALIVAPQAIPAHYVSQPGLLAAGAPKSPERNLPAADTAKTLLAKNAYGRLPLYFIANHGQMHPRVKFSVQTGGGSLAFTPKGVEMALPARQNQDRSPKTARLSLMGLKRQVQPMPLEPQTARFNYFFGKERSTWHTDVPSYGAVLYREAYPGIDLKFYGRGRELEYDVIVKPGADLKRVRFNCAGSRDLRVTPAGDLEIRLPYGGAILQKKPVVYQEIDGQRIAREGKFKVYGNSSTPTYGFEVAAYDRKAPLVIDPVLSFSSYLGGTYLDEAWAVALDSAGQAYITGTGQSADFPITNDLGLGWNYSYAFVTKLNAAGTAIVYSARLGGDGTSWGNAIAVDAAGQAYVAGATLSNPLNFPISDNAYQKVRSIGMDAYAVVLNAQGNGVVYGTYLGGSGEDNGLGIAVDASGNFAVCGSTPSTNFPVTNELYPHSSGSNYDGFVARFIPSAGSYLCHYSTCLGGTGTDVAISLGLDNSGNVYVTGWTASALFPTTAGAFYTVLQGVDGFITKIGINPSTNKPVLTYSTFFGGSGTDTINGLALDSLGRVYVVGGTNSDSDFPKVNPLYPNFAGTNDAFVAKLDLLNPPETALLFSTYLGGSGTDTGYAIALDQEASHLFVAGLTDSPNFPCVRAFQNSNAGGLYDLFVAKIKADGSAMVYSSYLGGSSAETFYQGGLKLDPRGRAYLVGGTESDDFPIRNPLPGMGIWKAEYKSGFVVRISDSVDLSAINFLLFE